MSTDQSIHFLVAGTLLGLSAGISPGPLLTLVLTQTIKHNKREGIKIALSPLLTDLPIILLTVSVFGQLAQFDLVLAIISVVGGIFVAFLGIESIKSKGMNLDLTDSNAQSLKKGIITNFLSPHPYLFWASVGAPYIFKSYEHSWMAAFMFITSFYVFLIGSKVMVAELVSRTKAFINQKLYISIMRLLGVALLIFALFFFYDGFKHFGWV